MNLNLGVVNGDLTTLFGFLGFASPSDSADSVAAASNVWKNNVCLILLLIFFI